MGILNSKQWISDIDDIISSLPELSDLAGKTIMITGVTGLVCSPIADIFIRYNETHENPIKIIAAVRTLEEIEGRFSSYCRKDYFKFAAYDASKSDNELRHPCDYIIHGASNASPDMVMSEPVETMLSNFMGMLYLLNYAKKYGVQRLLYISSSEVYGQKDGNKPYREDEYGYIDLLNPRSSYSVGKRATETLCASYADEYNVESVIVRPGHIYGPTASPTDNRVSSAWSYAAARGEDIVMKSDGTQLRSYCYCLDCASAVLKVLIGGESVCAYNISNPNSIVSIREMAELLAKAGDVKLIREMANEKERKAFNPMSNSSLDSIRLQDLGWKGLFDAERGFLHTVAVLRDMMGQGF